jgi:predicted nucleic acid-binding protein
MSPCLIDSGFLYALIDERDLYSSQAKEIVEALHEELVLPIPAITETGYFVSKYLGPEALAEFIQSIPNMGLILETPTAEDYFRSAEILRKFNDANLDFVDACIVAIAERLNITKILTIDRRHFGMFRPKHCAAFEILP